MTSSLVGSEMCIRDSGRTLRYGHWNGFDLSTRRGCEALAESLRLERPVSYTHLTLPTICSV
eukprot:6490229-Prorocentrum_lima.AAC.1